MFPLTKRELTQTYSSMYTCTFLKGYDYGSLSYFIIVKNKLVNKIEKKLGRNIV